MRLIKTLHCNTVNCNNGSYVCYNTLLNLPLVLDQVSYNFFVALPSMVEIEAYEGEQRELVSALQDAYLLLPVDTNEQTLLETLHEEYLRRLEKGKTLKYVDLRISEACNFGCHHCISSAARKQSLMKADVALTALDHIISYLRASQPDLHEIDFHYGNAEPLLNFPLVKQIQEHLCSTYPDISKVVSINTNLSLLNKEMADFLIEKGVLIYVSLDGPKKANDAIRVTKRGEGTFDLVTAKIDLLATRGFTIEGVGVTITDENFRFFDTSFADWCANRGFRSLAVDFDLVNSLSTPLAERVDFLVEMWQRCENLGMEFFGTWITPFLNISNRSVTESHYAFCKGIHGQSVSVDPEGMMYICGSSTPPLGHYSELAQTLRRRGKLYELVSSRLIGRLSFCHGCSIEGACAGQCYVTLEHSREKVREQCEYYRTLTQRLLGLQGAREAL